jgi:hypothetical protein
LTGSYPADGTGGLTITDWADYFNSDDGAIENYTNDALALTRVDSGSSCQIAPGNVSISGYRLKIDSTESLTCPTPASGTATYYIVAYYDPNLNVANSDGTAPRPLGPCRLALYSATEISSALAGKAWVLLYAITRNAGQTLTAAVVTNHIKWLGGRTMEWPTSAGTPPTGSYLAPRGTLRYALDTRTLYARTGGSSSLVWQDLFNDGPWSLPLASSFVARSGKNAIPQYYRFAGSMIGFQGQIQRTSGNLSNGNTVTLGTIPAGLRPGMAMAFICRCGGSNNYTEVRINNDSTTDGAILMTDPPNSTTWLDLSPISYRIGA